MSERRRPNATLAVVGLAVLGLAAAFGLAGGARSAAASGRGRPRGRPSAPATTVPSWSAPVTIDAGNSVNAVSCPTQTLCVAVDDAGNVLTSTDPSGGAGAWTATQIDDGNLLTTVSCPTTSLCLAADENGELLVSTDPTGDAGAWSGPEQIEGANQGDTITAISCASTTLCVAAGIAGDVYTATAPTHGAAAWSDAEIDQNSSLTDVACVTGGFCAAVDEGGDVVTTSNPTGGAGAWSAPVDIDGTTGLDGGIACASATLCAAIDSGGSALTSTDPAGGASAWSAASIEPGGAFEANAVSCVSGPMCVAVDGSGNALAAVDPTQGAGAWKTTDIDAGQPLNGVACTDGLCVAVDENGDVVTGTGTFGASAGTGSGATGGSGGSGGSTGGAGRPSLSRLHVAPRSVASVGGTGPSIDRRGPDTITYRDSLSARTTFTVLSREAGRRRDGRCTAVHHGRPRTGRRCIATHRLGRFAHSDTAGRIKLRFSTRVAGHALAAGHYELEAWARQGSKVSRTVSTTFTIVARAHR